MAGLYTESDYENSIIELFENIGYRYVCGYDLERDYSCPLYETELIDSIYRINPNIPNDGIRDALDKLYNFQNADLIQKNEVFMDYIQNGIDAKCIIKGEEITEKVYLVDYKNIENNSFVIGNQWTYVECDCEKRPDIILFVNGLPVVLIELKSPSRENTDVSEGYKQIRNYIQVIPSMFIYNCICVMSDQLTSKAGTITSDEERDRKSVV